MITDFFVQLLKMEGCFAFFLFGKKYRKMGNTVKIYTEDKPTYATFVKVTEVDHFSKDDTTLRNGRNNQAWSNFHACIKAAKKF